MKVLLTAVIVIGLFANAATAYDPWDDLNYRDSHPLFDDSALAEIRVTIRPEDLAAILANPLSDVYYPANMRFKNALVEDEATTVGFRIRGNTSRLSCKKSFKISFNEFVPGRRFHGLRKFNLNGEHNDPGIMRTRISLGLFKEFGVPSSRSSHCKLFINDEFRGVYIHVEEVDNTFTKSRFGNSGGNLFKCLWVGEPADLTWRADGRYDLVGGGRTYELLNNESNPDFSDLAHFIDVLNNTPDESFPQAIEQVFNVDSFLKWMAVSVQNGSWDDYLYNANNYFLYHNQETGRFEFIPYDYDNTFGISWEDRDWTSRDVYHFHKNGSPRPLAERILAHEAYKDRYSWHLDTFVTNHYSIEKIKPVMDRLRLLIRQAAADDTYRSCDYGWTIQDFDRSFTEALGGHVRWGFEPFIQLRAASTISQIQTYATPTPTPTPSPTPTSTPSCSVPVTIVINEMCASNSSLITDNHGEYEDWIELYNYGTETVDLGGLNITDNTSDPTKHRLDESLSIPAGGYLILWADGETAQGAAHLSFKLDKDGEDLVLNHRLDCGLEQIDFVRFGLLETDKSYGRLPDAEDNWIVFDKPTPGGPNVIATPTPTTTPTPTPAPTGTGTPHPSPTPTPTPTATITPTPTPIGPFYMDGHPDKDVPVIARTGERRLFGLIKEGWLYLAADLPGTPGADTFLLAASPPGTQRNAPWSKSGSIARWRCYAGHEGENNWNGWFDLSGATGHTAARTDGVFEVILKLDTAFAEPDAAIWAACGVYQTENEGSLIHGEQLPASINQDGNVDSEEYILVPHGFGSGKSVMLY